MLDHIGLLHLLAVAALALGLYQARRLLPARLLFAERRPAATNTSHRRQFIFLELTELTLAAMFFLVGGAKLIGQPDMIVLFREIGIGEWFRYLTGTVEVSGALLLVIPYLSGASAIGLGAVMIIASLVELFVLHRPPVAALACLTAHAFVAWNRMSRVSATPLRGDLKAELPRPACRP